jgi:superfamily II DNA or RNA helicase
MPAAIALDAGQLVEVRERRWVVADVDDGRLPADGLEPVAARQRLVTLRSVEDDAEPDETLQVVWELEPRARAFERAGLPAPDALDEPERFDAFLDAVRWGASSAADSRRLLAPFQSGVEIEAYQLDPLARALRMPRVSLLIADDVGLGKTIEAGLVAQELVLRYRVRRILVVTPADLQLQWRDEMLGKFGLEFRIVDRELMKRLRRERGVHVNPWTHFPRLITSMDYLKMERPLRRFRETLPGPDEPRYPRRYDLLIVDEAHNVAPAGRGRYALDSLRTSALREIVPHFEHRLFLTATPHNGYDESFTALLELLDDQRFARTVTPTRDALRQAMVRRLKRELPPRFDGTRRFPERKLIPIELDYGEEERRSHADLRRYTELRAAGAASRAERFATEFVLKLLKKRLLSSPAAFRRTLAKHRESLDRGAPDAGERQHVSIEQLSIRVSDAESAFASDAEYQDAEDGAQEAAARAQHALSPEELELLERLAQWAERAAARPDAKAEALIEWIEQCCRPAGRWSEERVIVFTEYRDTQKALLDLFAARGLTEGDRTLLLYGGMPTDERAHIKAAFQADPRESPVRILLATDAASEGINLQNHCHRLVHYEIPWNPNRLEQRNGRIDRHGQRAPEVLVYHFAPRGYESARARDLPAGELDGDLEFLCRTAEKVESIREMLGKVGAVIADQVTEAMLGRRARLDTKRAERDGERVSRQLAFERRLDAELRELQDSYDTTRAEQHLTPDHIEAAVRVALELARQPPLIPDGDGLWRLPALTGAWSRCGDGLPHPFTGEDRPITFDPKLLAGSDDVVLAHLGHRLVQMSLRLLRAEIWQKSATRSLQRVTARLVDDPRMRDPLAVVYGRLVVTGGAGHRLHEEVVQAGGWVRAGRLEHLGVNVLREALERPAHGRASDPMGERLVALHGELSDSLHGALEARARERFGGVRGLIKRRCNEEVTKITAVLNELRERILAELQVAASPQMRLFGEDERDQFERNRAFLGARAAEIPDEIERESEALRARFDDPAQHTFPIAVEYRVPAALGRL